MLHSDRLRSSIAWRATGVLVLLLAMGCDANLSSPRSAMHTEALLAKTSPTTSVSLSSVSPDSASILTTLDVKVNGSGLGLAIAYRILQDHGGEIEVSSTPGSGTSVVIKLPASLQHSLVTLSQ